jgi:hypothetical protein
VISVIYLLIKKNAARYKNDLLFWLIIIFVTVFLITPQSKFIWNYMQILAEAGSHRLLLLMGFFTSVLAGFLILSQQKKKFFVYTLIFLTIATTILNWGQRKMLPDVNDAVLKKDLPIGINWGDAHFYANSKWVNPNHQWFSVIPQSPILITGGQGKIIIGARTSTLHSYQVSAETSLRITENTLYFPGWKATFNNKSVNIGPDKNGVISFNLPKGNGILTLSFSDLPLFAASKIISLISLSLIFIYLLYLLIKKLLSGPKS